MDFFKQVATDFIDGLVVYYQDTNDPDISSTNFYDMVKKMSDNKNSAPYVAPISNQIEADRRGFGGLSAMIYSIEQLWREQYLDKIGVDINLMDSDGAKLTKSDVEVKLSSDSIEMMDKVNDRVLWSIPKSEFDQVCIFRGNESGREKQTMIDMIIAQQGQPKKIDLLDIFGSKKTIVEESDLVILHFPNVNSN